MPPPAARSALSRPATVLVFMTALNVLNFTDRFLIQGFAVDLCADLHLGGWLADRMEARRAGGRLRLLAWAALVGVPVGWAYRFADPAGAVFLPAIFVGSVMVTLGYGPLFAALQDRVEARLRSTMTAAMILGMTLFGTSGGNLFVGLLADRLRADSVAQPITHAAALGLAPWLLAVPCLFMASAIIPGRRVGDGLDPKASSS